MYIFWTIWKITTPSFKPLKNSQVFIIYTWSVLTFLWLPHWYTVLTRAMSNHVVFGFPIILCFWISDFAKPWPLVSHPIRSSWANKEPGRHILYVVFVVSDAWHPCINRPQKARPLKYGTADVIPVISVYKNFLCKNYQVQHSKGGNTGVARRETPHWFYGSLSVSPRTVELGDVTTAVHAWPLGFTCFKEVWP